MLRHVPIEIPRVQDGSQLAASVLPVRPHVFVYLVQAGKLGVAGRLIVYIASLVADPDDVALLRRLLHQRQQVAGQDDVADMVDSHVPVYAVGGQFGRHDASTRIIDEDIEPVSVALDGLGDFLDAEPVTEIALHPDRAVSFVLAQLLCHGIFGALDDLLGDGEDVDLGDVVLQERVRDAEADTLAASRYDGNFPREIRAVVEFELM